MPFASPICKGFSLGLGFRVWGVGVKGSVVSEILGFLFFFFGHLQGFWGICAFYCVEKCMYLGILRSLGFLGWSSFGVLSGSLLFFVNSIYAGPQELL